MESHRAQQAAGEAGGRCVVLVPRPGTDLPVRLDAWLAQQLPEHSRAEVQRWLRQRRVRAWRADGSVLEAPAPKTPVRSLVRVEVAIPPPRRVELQPEPIAITVLYEDEALLVLDKPAGMVVHPSPGHESGTLVNALLYRGGPLAAAGAESGRPGLVHRLDRDTSGVLVVARTDAVHRALVREFKARRVDKRYLAIVEGRPPADELWVREPIGRSTHHRKKMAVTPDGRPAETRVRLLERRGPYSVLECAPRTGRTHQIRVHLRHLGTPILCDRAYGRRSAIGPSELRQRARRPPGEQPVLARQALHAMSLELTHPLRGERVRFEAPLPADLRAVLALLREAYPEPVRD